MGRTGASVEDVMKIGLIGGLTRSEAFFRKMALEKGHELDFHTGELSRRSIEGMRSLVKRSDLIIILTGINSHQAVWLAKQAAREFMRPSVITRRCGPDSFREMLDLLGGPGRWSGTETARMGKGEEKRNGYIQ